MSHHIVFLAGGLGSRLKNTENKPKPLVDINGLRLISRIISSFYQTKLFKKFHILTCLNSDLFQEILKIEIPDINYGIKLEQPGATGIGIVQAVELASPSNPGPYTQGTTWTLSWWSDCADITGNIAFSEGASSSFF